jgi:hypothetical protein
MIFVGIFKLIFKVIFGGILMEISFKEKVAWQVRRFVPALRVAQIPLSLLP